MFAYLFYWKEIILSTVKASSEEVFKDKNNGTVYALNPHFSFLSSLNGAVK